MPAPDWIFWATAAPLALAGLALLYLGLFHDRARGRRRCPRCWYDMGGIAGLKCPECGRSATGQRHLLRARRRWSRVFISALPLAASYASWSAPAIMRGGWRTAVPGLVVAYLAPADGTGWTWTGVDQGFGETKRFGQPNDAWAVEALRRLNARTMSGVASQLFLDRFFSAFPDQTHWLVAGRDRWPSELAFATRRGLSFPIRDDTGLALRLRFRLVGADWVTTSFDTYGMVNLGVPPDGSRQVEAQLLDGLGRTLWTGVVRTLQVGGSASDIMTPLASENSARLKAANASVLDLEPKLGYGDDGLVRLLLRRTSGRLAPATPDWALGATCRVLHGDKVVASGEVLYHIDPNPRADFFNLYDPFALDWTATPPAQFELRDGTWTVELTGDPAVAVRDFDRDIYWNGSVTAPLTELVEPEGWDYEFFRRLEIVDDK